MTAPRVCVLRAPGTNCDLETAYAFETSGATAESVHLHRLLDQPGLLHAYQILCVPGGFSYGDDVGAGVIGGMQLRFRLQDALQQFLERDTLILGICNGFQLVLKSGLLPDGAAGLARTEPPDVTLTWNTNGRYTARWVHLRVTRSDCIFFQGMESLELPIAHAEGRIAVREPGVIEQLRTGRRVAAVYATPPGTAAVDEDGILPFPHNPNGSTANIAALCDPSGRILGMMPHPERYLFGTQHPQWTRRELAETGDGRRIFDNAVRYFG